MVTAGLAPRQALAQVEARLEAAGCPTPALTPGSCSGWRPAGMPRLSDRPLSAEEAARLEELTGPPGRPGAFAVHLRAVALFDL